MLTGLAVQTKRVEAKSNLQGESPVLDLMASIECPRLTLTNDLRPTIRDITGPDVDAQISTLGDFETMAAGLVARHRGAGLTLTAHCLLAPGQSPGAIAQGSLQEYHADDVGPHAAILCDGESHEVRYSLRSFAARQFALVERNIHGPLTSMWEAIPEATRCNLRLHFILTVRRDSGCMGEHNPVHADTFDGTMCAFGLMSTKVPTPIFPVATFEPSALERVVQEAAGADRSTRPPEIHTSSDAGARPSRGGCLVVLPPSVAHSIPNTPESVESQSSTSELGTLLSKEGSPRWFCRVSIEVVPDGPPVDGAWNQWRRAWPGGADTRRRIALLAVRHAWGDSALAERARAQMGLDMTGWW